jgi:hypothetical protein
MSKEDFFSHGASYPPENGKVRSEPCSSCAFINTPESVRPADTSLAELEAMTAEYDGFLCHCLDEDGKTFGCAGWHARFGRAEKAADSDDHIENYFVSDPGGEDLAATYDSYEIAQGFADTLNREREEEAEAEGIALKGRYTVGAHLKDGTATFEIG